MTAPSYTFTPDFLERIRHAQHIAIVTGAGVSAESGIPTFRDRLTGLWNEMRVEDVATAEGFARNPAQVWEFYRAFQQRVLAARPNAAHAALATIERHIPSCTIITQNVDGLHQRAGSQQVLELHGSLLRLRCSQRPHAHTSAPMAEALAACPQCGAWMRPDIVWFGEAVDAELLAQAQAASFACDVCFVIGTSGIVAPAATFPMTARGHGALLVDINPENTPVSRHARYRFRGTAGAILAALAVAAWPSAQPPEMR